MKLVLEDEQGRITRTFSWSGDAAVLIRRLDSGRMEVRTSVADLDAQLIDFEPLADLTRQDLENAPYALKGEGRLRLVMTTDVEPLNVLRDPASEPESEKPWLLSLCATTVLIFSFVLFLMTRSEDNPRLEADLKTQLVQIVRRIQPKVKPVTALAPTVSMRKQAIEPLKPTTQVTAKTMALKRMGALAALGSKPAAKQRGGLDLGAVNTTAGPGLGGTGGSGGAQTSVYGKGIVAAPLGAGNNMQGGGGYGTKGRGGGQAGYGKLSLIGASGGMPIPLGREAIIQGGLDRDLIADVINKNIGQIRFCYEQGLQSEPSLNGRVAVAFTINGNGQVSAASVANTTLNARIVEDCIVLRLRGWKFPLPDGGVDVKVTYPFVLRRSGQG